MTLSQRTQSLVSAAVMLSLVAPLTLLLWRTGCLQDLDFLLYDHFIANQSRPSPNTSPIVVVGITEDDIRQFDYPLPDQLLSQFLDRIAAGQPRAIGLDLYRDLPEPRSGAELSSLQRTFHRLTNLFVIQRIPDASNNGTSPPPGMTKYPERIGFNNFPLDAALGKKVRRGLLYADIDTPDGAVTLHSFALRLALQYLRPLGIEPIPSPETPTVLRLGHHDFPPLTSNSGAYVHLDTGGYQVLLDFQGPASFKSCRLSDVMNDRVPPDLFTDQIVLIGATTESTIRDHHLTPLAKPIHGVELHAHWIDQLIRGATDGPSATPPMRFLPEWTETGLVLLCCLAGVALPAAVRSVPWALGLVAASTALLFAANQWALHSQLWIPVAPAVTALVPAAILTTSQRLARERRDRTILMQLFAKHVSPEIAEVLWQQRSTFIEGQRPRPSALTATLLFADLRGFTNVATQLPPPELIDWLNQYLETMTTQILQHGGIINEFIGDGIMATFGIPVPRQTEAEISTDAARAVESALAMASQLELLNHSWSAENRPTARLRIGIHTGPVVIGSVGNADRLKFAVVGDAVNAAQRLESFDKEFNASNSPIPNCRVLVAQSTWDRIEARFEGSRVGEFVLKGRSELSTIYQVFRRKPKDLS